MELLDVEGLIDGTVVAPAPEVSLALLLEPTSTPTNLPELSSNVPPEPTNKPPTHINGRFAPGNKFGGGSPYASQVAKFRKELFTSVTTGDVAKITSELVAQAKAGSIKHQTLFYDLLGLRVKQVEISGDASQLKTYISVDIDRV